MKIIPITHIKIPWNWYLFLLTLILSGSLPSHIVAQPGPGYSLPEIQSCGNRSGCPQGRDSLHEIWPFHDGLDYFYPEFGLDFGGTWYPPLATPGVYNSCSDSNSVYVYSRSVEGCPEVIDTATFKLNATPPCNFTLESMCFSSEAFHFTVPAYTKSSAEESYQLTVELNNWPNPEYEYLQETYELDFDSTYQFSIPWEVEAEMGCTWISVNGWIITPYHGPDLWWECDIPVCSTTGMGTGYVKSDPMLHVYPNPATDVIHFDPGPDHPVKVIQILDMNGKTVWQEQSTGKVVDVRLFPAGLYILRMLTATEILAAKWIKT